MNYRKETMTEMTHSHKKTTKKPMENTNDNYEDSDEGQAQIVANIDLTQLQLDYYINLVTNTVNFTGEFNLESIEALIIRMDFLRMYNPDQAINLRISSYGGDAYSLFAILDYIHSIPEKVNGYVYGAALSAAAWLLVCLTGERTMGKHSSLLIHEGDTVLEGKITDLAKTSKQLEWIGDKMISLLVEHSDKPKSFWLKNQKTEMYFDAETSLKYGLVDAIGGVHVNHKT